MEYQPRFLAEWHPETGGAKTGILREQILQRYREVLPNVPQRPFLEDVIGLTIAADGASIAKMKELCENFGYHASIDREATILEGPDFALRLIPETASARGIKQVIFRVRRSPTGQSQFTFGSRSVLSFQHNGRAVWVF